MDALSRINKPDAEIRLMIEVNEPKRCQFEFPANDLAHAGNVIIIMHEKWVSMESLDPKSP